MRHGMGVIIVFIICPAIMLIQGTAFSDASPEEGPNALGIAVGVPQTVAVTYCRALTSRIQMSIHAGSAVLFSAAGARVHIGSLKRGLRPYAFAGYALIHSTAEDWGDPTGISGYFWLGPGLSLRARRWTLFADICALFGGNPDRGLGDRTWIFPFDPAISGGLMFRF